VGLSAANTHDSLLLEQLVDAVPAAIGPRGRPGRPRRRPESCTLTRAMPSDLPAGPASPWHHPRIARRGVESSQRLGRYRWVVEPALGRLVGCRRLQVRYERRADILRAWLWLACALMGLRRRA
jgi:transposase